MAKTEARQAKEKVKEAEAVEAPKEEAAKVAAPETETKTAGEVMRGAGGGGAATLGARNLVTGVDVFGGDCAKRGSAAGLYAATAADVTLFPDGAGVE